MGASIIKGNEIKRYTITSENYTLNPGYAERCGNTVLLNVRVNRAETTDPVALGQIPIGARPSSSIFFRVGVAKGDGAIAPAISVTTDGAISTTASGIGDIRILVMYFTSNPF